MRRMRSSARGFTLLEVVIASALLMVLMALAFEILGGQTKLGQQQQTRAFGAAQAQRAFGEVATTLRGCVYEPLGTWPAQSDFCILTGDNFARLKLYQINKAQPYSVTPPYVLQTSHPLPSYLLGVVDQNGNWVGKTSTGPGNLVYGVDTSGSGTPTSLRTIAQNVTQFQVTVPRAGLLQVNVRLSLKTGDMDLNAQALTEQPTASGQVLINQYDSTIMK